MYESYRGIKVTPMESGRMTELLTEKVRKVVSEPEKVEEVVRSIKSEYITIDTTPLLGESDGSSWTGPYGQFKSVQELLNTIYFALPPDRIKPYTYGKSWMIRGPSR